MNQKLPQVGLTQQQCQDILDHKWTFSLEGRQEQCHHTQSNNTE